MNEIAMISSDTGSGIAAKELIHVFERGVSHRCGAQVQCSGTGLGLHFARAIAEAHGGRIEVHSVPGERFVFARHPAMPGG